MTKKDYYNILDVRRNASDKEIKQTYRRLARQYHPDVNPDDLSAEQKFKEISEAYAVLSNPESRKNYDRFGHQTFASGFDPAFARGGGQTNVKDFFGGRPSFDGLSAILEELWGSGRQRTQPAAVPGQDLEQIVDLSFEEAVRGTTTPVQVIRRDGGAERLQVKIPSGVDTNSKVRVAGKGESGKHSGPPGDLYILIRVRPHAYFTRQGSDILCDVPVTLSEVLLGAKIDVPTIDGTTTMTLPAGTQNGRRFRLRGKGAPALHGGGPGDHYVTVQVVLPDTLDVRSRELLEEFATRNPLQPRAHMRW